MSYEIPGLNISLVSSGDMSSHQYKAVRASTTNAVDGCVLLSARGTRATGVYQHNSTTSEAGKVMVLGVTKMQAGDSSGMESAIAVGAPVMASSVGAAVPSTDTSDARIGFALEPLGTGSTGIIAVLLCLSATSTA